MLRLFIFLWVIGLSFFSSLQAQTERSVVRHYLDGLNEKGIGVAEFKLRHEMLVILSKKNEFTSLAGYTSWHRSVVDWCETHSGVFELNFCGEYFRNTFLPMILEKGLERTDKLEEYLDWMGEIYYSRSPEHQKALLKTVPHLFDLLRKEPEDISGLKDFLYLLRPRRNGEVDPIVKRAPYSVPSVRYNLQSKDQDNIPFISKSEPLFSQLLKYLLHAMEESQADQRSDAGPVDLGRMLNEIMKKILKASQYEFKIPAADVAEIDSLVSVWLLRNSKNSAFYNPPVYVLSSDGSVNMRFPRSTASIDTLSLSGKEMRRSWRKWGFGKLVDFTIYGGLVVAISQWDASQNAHSYTPLLLGTAAVFGLSRCAGAIFTVNQAIQGRIKMY